MTNILNVFGGVVIDINQDPKLLLFNLTLCVVSKNCNPTGKFPKMAAFLYSKNAQMNEDARINEEKEHDIEDGELLEEI